MNVRCDENSNNTVQFSKIQKQKLDNLKNAQVFCFSIIKLQ